MTSGLMGVFHQGFGINLAGVMVLQITTRRVTIRNWIKNFPELIIDAEGAIGVENSDEEFSVTVVAKRMVGN